MNRSLLLLALLCCIARVGYSQQIEACDDPGTFLLATQCGQACVLCDMDGFTARNENGTSGIAPDGFCASALHNIQWVGFVAGSEDIEFEVSVSNCTPVDEDDNGINDGLQIGIYNTTDCSNFQEVMPCVGQIEEGASATFTNTDPLTIGGIYYFVVDGFNADTCDFTIDVLSGSTMAPGVDQNPPEITVPEISCPNSSVTASVDPVFGAGAYFWTLDGAEVGTDPTITFQVPGTSGDVELCVTPYNPCSQGVQNCTTITVEPLADIIDIVSICEGETYSWPANNFPYFDSGSYQHITFVNGICLQRYFLELTVEEAETNSVSASICAGDTYTVSNPHTGEDFDFTSAGNYTVELSTSAGCDSTVNLNLSVLPANDVTEDVSICSGDTYTVTDGTFSETISTTGSYSYVLEAANGCDSNLTLNLTVLADPPPTQDNVTICQGESYTFNGNTYSTAGTYSATFPTVVLGCDSLVNLNLSVHVPESTITETICQGDAFDINGTSYTSSGSYTVTIPNGSYLGCDSLVNLTLTVEPASQTDQFESICEGESVMVGNQTFNQAGTYAVVVSTGAQCDEVVNLTLEVNPNEETYIYDETCFGYLYEFNGEFFGLSGLYQANLQTAAGCDSIVTLDLLVRDQIYELQTPTICEGEVYEVGNQSYSTAGSYLVNLLAADGCDSTIEVILDVLPALTGTASASICEGQSYSFGGTDYDASGEYMATFQTAEGCDSTVTLTLTVSDVIEETITASICSGQSYLFDGMNYSTAGQYMASYQTAAGCDSTVTLNLSVSDALTETVNSEICEGQSVTIGTNNTFDQTGQYEVSLTSTGGCDSIVTLNLNVVQSLEQTELMTICAGDTVFVGSSAYTNTGIFSNDYISSAGCDSTYILDLTVLPQATATIDPVICAGTSFTAAPGNTFDQTGQYEVTLTAANGCDSILTVNLTVEAELTGQESISLCDGETLTVDGMTFDQSGQYDFPYVTAEGCDSIHTIDLTILPPLTNTIDVQICEGSSYQIGNETLTMPGQYDVTLSSAGGCDSLVTVNLSQTTTVFNPIEQSLCEGDTAYISTIPYTTTGDYEELFVTPTGCDSIVQLALTILPNPSATIDPVICSGSSYAIGDSTFTQTGQFAVTLTSQAGCDSTVTVNLTVAPPLVGMASQTICEGDTVVVANEIYTTTGLYETAYTTADGCDSLYQLDLTVIPTSVATIDPVICTGQSFSIGDSTFTAAGQYEVLLTAASGCDSVVTVNLTVSGTLIETASMTICEGESVTVGSSTYDASGQYEDSFVTAEGCDSLYQLDLTVTPTSFATIDPQICAGEVFEIGTGSYSATGQYEETLTSALGCDSIVTINLTVAPTPISNITASICEDGSYSVGDSTFTAAGLYEVILTTTEGCDSTVMLDLAVTDFYQTNLAIVLCEGESYELGSSSYDATGSYNETFTALDGCDSIVTLDLQVNPLLSETISATICEGESFSIAGVDYSTTGMHSETIPSLVTGCDSTVTLDLTVNPVYDIAVMETICDGESVIIGDSTYTNTGTFATLLQSIDGCDSLVTLDLEVIAIPEETINATICDGETYEVGASSYNSSGTYQDILTSVVSGCDSIVNLTLTVDPILETPLTIEICDGESYEVGPDSFTESGNYTTVLTSIVTGCDSLVMLDLTVNEVYETILTESICTGESYMVGMDSFDETGQYSVSLTTVAGCDSTVILNLAVAPCSLVFALENSPADCNGSATGSLSLALTVGTPPYNYTYTGQTNGQTGNGTIENNDEEITIPGLGADTYLIQITDANGVMIEGQRTISEPAAIALALTASQYGVFNTSCEGESDGSLTVTAQGGSAPFTYAWSNGATGATVSNLGAGTYGVTATDANGCEQITEGSLSAPPVLTASSEATDPPCFGDASGQISVQPPQGGTPPYLYAVDGGAFTGSPLFVNLEVGVHQIAVQDANGCEYSEEVMINAAQELIVDLGDDIRMEFGDTINLEALTSYPVVRYRWSGGPLIDCATSDTLDCYDPRIAPGESTNYTVQVVDANGCTAEDQIQVIVSKPRDVYIPTAFSPDDDGINDRFGIFGGDGVRSIQSFAIYNRWGETMFEIYDFLPNAPGLGWDGTHRGQIMNPGVYVYFAEVEFIDGEVILYTGEVMLLR